MFLVLSLVTVGLGFFLHYNRMAQQNSHFSQHQEVLSTAYKASLQTYRLAMDSFYANTISRPEIAALFAEGINATDKAKQNLARGRLYRRLYAQYASMKSHNLVQLHFHTTIGKSFLRFHKPDRYGDSLMDIRPSVHVVNEKQQPVYGFEAGRVRSGFRYVYPIFWQAKHVGSVEVSVTIKAIRDVMAELDPHQEYAFVLSRQLTEPIIFPEQRWLYRPSDLHPDFMVEDADALLPDSPPPLSSAAVMLNRRLARNAMVQDVMKKGEAVTVSTFAGGPTLYYLFTADSRFFAPGGRLSDCLCTGSGIGRAPAGIFHLHCHGRRLYRNDQCAFNGAAPAHDRTQPGAA